MWLILHALFSYQGDARAAFAAAQEARQVILIIFLKYLTAYFAGNCNVAVACIYFVYIRFTVLPYLLSVSTQILSNAHLLLLF